MDKFIVVSCLALVVVVAGLIGATVFWSPAAPASEQYTADGALTVAEKFVKDEATFVFDGDASTLKVALNRTVDSSTFEVVAEYTSMHGGFGNRTGLMVLEVLTPHKAVITVDKGQIVSAVMDGQWDMLTQKVLKSDDVLTPPATMPALDPGNNTPSAPPAGANL